MNPVFAFIQDNAEAICVGTLVLCIGTVLVGIVAFIVMSLEGAFDVEGDF